MQEQVVEGWWSLAADSVKSGLYKKGDILNLGHWAVF